MSILQGRKLSSSLGHSSSAQVSEESTLYESVYIDKRQLTFSHGFVPSRSELEFGIYLLPKPTYHEGSSESFGGSSDMIFGHLVAVCVSIYLSMSVSFRSAL